MSRYQPDLTASLFTASLSSASGMARQHRQKLFDLFEDSTEGIVYVRGAAVQHRYDTDTEISFRQESNFWYLSGVNEADYHLILDIKSRHFHLFTPKRDTMYAVWNGRVKTLDEIRALYAPDELHYDTELASVLADLAPQRIFVLDEAGKESLIEALGAADSAGEKSAVVSLVADRFETTTLRDALTFCRLHKTAAELERMRFAGKVNSYAHNEVLKALNPNVFEYEMKAVLDTHLMRHGLLHPAYNGIFASGSNSAILHYVENTRQMKDGELFLIDSGYEFEGYSSDITRTWPVNGVFNPDQRAVYSTVLEGQKAAIEATRAGVKMEDLHLMTTRVMMEGLIDAGFLKGSVDEIMEKNIFALFFPHGLGHFLGLDTHDPGGYPKGVERIDRPGIRYLRLRRELEDGMVITIEPGLYFIPALLLPAFENAEQKPYLNVGRLEKMLQFGGVRIEDNLVVREDGNENLTTVVKEIADVESMYRG
jgi:Xaa-Pro dipeptidase